MDDERLICARAADVAAWPGYHRGSVIFPESLNVHANASWVVSHNQAAECTSGQGAERPFLVDVVCTCLLCHWQTIACARCHAQVCLAIHQSTFAVILPLLAVAPAAPYHRYCEMV